MTVYEKGLITLMICYAIFCIISVPLVLKKVPRNPVYGFRTRATLRDDKIWFKANAYFGSRFIIANLLSAFITVALYIWKGLSPDIYLKISVALLVAPVVVAALLTKRHINNNAIP
jgi:uncharacterized membrane protein